MRGVLLQPTEHRWECPNCDVTSVTRVSGVHTEFHNCRGLRGLSAPMVPAGTKAKVTSHLREDYIGADDVRRDGDGRPVMSVVTTRDTGEDCTVYAPTARLVTDD